MPKTFSRLLVVLSLAVLAATPASCTVGDRQTPAPAVLLDDGFAPGEVFLVVPPAGFTPASDTVDGWGQLAVGADCELVARTGQRPTRPGDDPRALTADLLDDLAAMDGGQADTSDLELNYPDEPQMKGVPVLGATWTASGGPVRALARVVVADDFSGGLSTTAIAVQLRCSDHGAKDIDAVWDQVTAQLRVQFPPSAGTWERIER